MKRKTRSGWSVEWLQGQIAEAEAKLAEIEASSHPFRSEMLFGQRLRIRNLREYLDGKGGGE